MRIASISMLFVYAAPRLAERRRAIDIPAGRFDVPVRNIRPSYAMGLRAGLKRAAVLVQGVIADSLRQKARRAASRETEENIRRLEELSPHLLDDIGVGKLESGAFELQPKFYPTDPTSPALAHDISLPPTSVASGSPPARPKRSPGVTGKAPDEPLAFLPGVQHACIQRKAFAAMLTRRWSAAPKSQAASGS
jgi:hypothetical protein